MERTGKIAEKHKISVLILFFVLSICGNAASKPVPKKHTHKEYFSNGKIRRIIHFEKGKFVKKKVYYKNGKLADLVEMDDPIGEIFAYPEFFPDDENVKEVFTKLYE